MKPATAAIQLTFWSEASRDHASRSPSPGSERRKRTSGTCGRTSPDSSANSDPLGSLLRTCLASELSRLTKCSRTWKRQATPAGRSWWVLTTLERRTGGSGCGSWPTACANDDNKTPEAHMAMKRRMKGGARHTITSLQVMAKSLWPTATAGDAAQSGAASYSTESGRHAGTTLTDAAAGLWASPQARDWKDSGPTQGNRKSPNLGTQAHWTTPQAQDAKQTPCPRSSLGREQIAAQAERAAMFPTPKASAGRSKGTGGTADHGLDAMARAGLLAPGSLNTNGKSRDWPMARVGMERCEGAYYSRGRGNLEEEAGAEEFKAGRRGVLNSRWVAQLMNYPSDWCDLPNDVLDALIAKPSRRMATQSFLPSSPQSAAPSSRRKAK